jgi:hypothetical protein
MVKGLYIDEKARGTSIVYRQSYSLLIDSRIIKVRSGAIDC